MAHAHEKMLEWGCWPDAESLIFPCHAGVPSNSLDQYSQLTYTVTWRRWRKRERVRQRERERKMYVCMYIYIYTIYSIYPFLQCKAPTYRKGTSYSNNCRLLGDVCGSYCSTIHMIRICDNSWLVEVVLLLIAPRLPGSSIITHPSAAQTPFNGDVQFNATNTPVLNLLANGSLIFYCFFFGNIDGRWLYRLRPDMLFRGFNVSHGPVEDSDTNHWPCDVVKIKINTWYLYQIRPCLLGLFPCTGLM